MHTHGTYTSLIPKSYKVTTVIMSLRWKEWGSESGKLGKLHKATQLMRADASPSVGQQKLLVKMGSKPYPIAM